MESAFLTTIDQMQEELHYYLEKNLEYKIHKQIKDNEGNFLVIDVTAQQQRFTLINIDGPNSDSPSFF